MSDSVKPPVTRKTYKRLPGRGVRLSAMVAGGDRQSLYLGPDHLLALRRSGYDESAKRFFFNDIQAVTVQTNGARTLIAFALGAVLAGFGILVGVGLNSESEDTYYGAMFVSSVVGIPLLLVFIVNLLMGPTCSVYLHTAVQVERLTALSRLRTARKCMAILAQRIQESQGALTGENVASMAAPASMHRASANALNPTHQSPAKPLSPRLPRAAYTVMMLFAVSAMVDLVFRHDVKDFFDLLLFGALIVLLLVVVVRQTNSTLPAASRRTNWTALLYNSVMFIVMMYMVIFAQAIMNDTPPTPLTTYGLPRGGDMPRWFYYLSSGLGALDALIALFGFATLRGYSVTTRTAYPDFDPAE